MIVVTKLLLGIIASLYNASDATRAIDHPAVAQNSYALTTGTAGEQLVSRNSMHRAIDTLCRSNTTFCSRAIYDFIEARVDTAPHYAHVEFRYCTEEGLRTVMLSATAEQANVVVNTSSLLHIAVPASSITLIRGGHHTFENARIVAVDKQRIETPSFTVYAKFGEVLFRRTAAPAPDACTMSHDETYSSVRWQPDHTKVRFIEEEIRADRSLYDYLKHELELLPVPDDEAHFNPLEHIKAGTEAGRALYFGLFRHPQIKERYSTWRQRQVSKSARALEAIGQR